MYKNKTKKYTNIEILMFVLISTQILYLLITNLLRTKYLINLDSSEYMIQVMQIWKQKTLLIEDYYYSTMLTWDMPTLLAVVFYGIFQDVFFAYGLANNVLIILFVLMLNKLCNDLEYSRIAKGLVFLAVFTVYQYGFVDYIEELFVNGALYGFRILFMLMLMDVLICIHKRQPFYHWILIYIGCLVGVFLCGLSSGIFELGCCIFPIVLYELWNVLEQENNIHIRDFIQTKTILPIVAAIFCALGIVTNYLLGFTGSSAAQKTTIKATEMVNNITGNFVGIFQLFGWTDTNIVITSLEGIMAFAGFAAACATIFVFIIGTKISIKNDKGNEAITIHKVYGKMVFCVFLVNVLLFCLADLSYSSPTCEYRYWVMVVIPVFLEIGLVYDWAKENISYNYRITVVLLYVMLLCLINGYKDTKLWKVDLGADSFEKMMTVAEDKELETIFIYGDYFSSRGFAAFAKESMDVFAIANMTLSDTGGEWITNKLRMPRWGTYVKYDTDCLSTGNIDRFGVFVSEDIGEDYNFLIARASEIIEFEFSGYKLLIMNKNYIDFVYGLPEVGKTQSRDFFNWGYDKSNLVLGENGQYQAVKKDGDVLIGDFIAQEDGIYNAVLKYEIVKNDSLEPIEFIITVRNDTDEEIVYKKELIIGETEVVLENIVIQERDEYIVSISSNAEAVLELEQIDYYKAN